MTEFLDQLSGSGAANGLSALAFLLIWIIRNKCKHSKCVGHSLCCDIEINDESTTDLERGEGRAEISHEVEKEVYTLHTPDNSSIHKEH